MSTAGTPPGTAGKVPVWRTAIGSYGFVFSNLDRFAVLACVPVLIVFGTELAVHLIHSPLAGWMFTLVSLAAWAVFVVRWHRLVLLEDRGGAFRAVLALRNLRVFAYALFWFLILMFAFPIYLGMAIYLLDLLPYPATTVDLPGTIPELTGRPLVGFEAWLVATIILAPSIILAFLALRFTLVLPGAAVDRPMSIVDAWRELRGNSWRYIGAIIIGIVLPFIFVDLFVSLYWSGLTTATIGVVGTELPVELRTPREVRTPINLKNGVIVFSMTVFDTLMLAVGITVLSKFYRHIVGEESGEGGAVVGP